MASVKSSKKLSNTAIDYKVNRTITKLDKAGGTKIFPIGKPRSYIEQVKKAGAFVPGPG